MITTLLIGLALLAGQDDTAVRDQVEAVIRAGFTRESLDKLGRMPGAGGVVVKMVDEGDKRIVPLVSILGAIKARDSEEFLLRMLKHFEETVRVSAACSLARLESKKAADGIAALLRDREIEDDDRAQVAWALGELGDVKGLPALKAYQSDLQSRGVQLLRPLLETKHAIRKLEILALADDLQREKGLSDVLVAAHRDGAELALRAWAARRLGDGQFKSTAPLIRAALPEFPAGSDARVEALQALRKLGGKLSEAELKELGTP